MKIKTHSDNGLEKMGPLKDEIFDLISLWMRYLSQPDFPSMCVQHAIPFYNNGTVWHRASRELKALPVLGWGQNPGKGFINTLST